MSNISRVFWEWTRNSVNVNCLPSHSFHLKHTQIRKCLQQQINIGWNNFFKGVQVKSWSEFQNSHYIELKSGHKYSGQNWAAKFTTLMIEFINSLWTTRCEILHNEKEHTQEGRIRKNAEKRCVQLLITPTHLLHDDRHLLTRKAIFFKKSRIQNILNWNERVNIATKRAKEFSTCKQTTLTSWIMQPPDPPIPEAPPWT